MRLPGRAGTPGRWQVTLAAALAVAATAVPAAAPAYQRGLGPAGNHRAAGAPGPCRSFSTRTWLGLGNGSGTLDAMSYPVEVSNTSTRTCTLNGIPAVWAVSGTGVQVGLPATASGTPHRVVLRPGRSAHATLEITPGRDIARCKQRPGSYLQVKLPGQRPATTIPGLAVTACANASVLRVGPVQPAVGVPGLAGALSSAREP